MSQKVLVNLDLGGNQILNVLLQVLASDPSSPIEGRIYYNSTSHAPRYYDGSAWIELGPGGEADTLEGHAGSYYLDRANHTGTQLAATISDFDTQVRTSRLDQLAAPTADVSLNSHKITNLADPTSAQDAATRAYVLAQVAALINSAPGVLDTLNELAAALGNDPNFATTIAGQIDAAKDRANHTGVQDVSTVTGAMRRYAVDVGDNSSTAIVITHNLNTRDVVVQLRRATTPWEVVIPDIEMTSVNTVTLRFATAPTTAQYRAIVIG